MMETRNEYKEQTQSTDAAEPVSTNPYPTNPNKALVESDPFVGILTEKEVLDFLGIKKTALDYMRRNRGLPFCKMTQTARLYLVSDVRDFITNNRTILNRAEMSDGSDVDD